MSMHRYHDSSFLHPHSTVNPSSMNEKFSTRSKSEIRCRWVSEFHTTLDNQPYEKHLNENQQRDANSTLNSTWQSIVHFNDLEQERKCLLCIYKRLSSPPSERTKVHHSIFRVRDRERHIRLLPNRQSSGRTAADHDAIDRTKDKRPSLHTHLNTIWQHTHHTRLLVLTSTSVIYFTDNYLGLSGWKSFMFDMFLMRVDIQIFRNTYLCSGVTVLKDPLSQKKGIHVSCRFPLLRAFCIQRCLYCIKVRNCKN